MIQTCIFCGKEAIENKIYCVECFQRYERLESPIDFFISSIAMRMNELRQTIKALAKKIDAMEMRLYPR